MFEEGGGGEGEGNSDEPEIEDEELFALSRKGSVCNVLLGNYDLSNIVYGYPNDPIEKRPFSFLFVKERILKWWANVGFLPMSRAALKNPKVRWEMGEGGAPEEASARMDLLQQDYLEGVAMLKGIGFNAEVLDIEPPKVEVRKGLPGREERIEGMVKENKLARSGNLFKIGVQVANGEEILEAKSRIDAAAEEEAAKKEQKKKEAEADAVASALECYVQWRDSGRKRDAKGNPALSKKASSAIVHFLLPKIDPEKEVKEFKTMKVCNEWLGGVASGTTWDAEMESFLQQSGGEAVAVQLVADAGQVADD